jgi:hypothetical protein
METMPLVPGPAVQFEPADPPAAPPPAPNPLPVKVTSGEQEFRTLVPPVPNSLSPPLTMVEGLVKDPVPGSKSEPIVPFPGAPLIVVAVEGPLAPAPPAPPVAAT